MYSNRSTASVFGVMDGLDGYEDGGQSKLEKLMERIADLRRRFRGTSYRSRFLVLYQSA